MSHRGVSSHSLQASHHLDKLKIGFTMGSAPSKAERQLPKTKPTWAGARTPAPGEAAGVQLPKQTNNLPPEAMRASEIRTEGTPVELK